MFDPVVGRFLEEDPSGFAPGDPDLFRYVENAPTNATDPSGLDRLDTKGNGHWAYWEIEKGWGTPNVKWHFGTVSGDLVEIDFHGVTGRAPKKDLEQMISERNLGGLNNGLTEIARIKYVLQSAIISYNRSNPQAPGAKEWRVERARKEGILEAVRPREVNPHAKWTRDDVTALLAAQGRPEVAEWLTSQKVALSGRDRYAGFIAGCDTPVASPLANGKSLLNITIATHYTNQDAVDHILSLLQTAVLNDNPAKSSFAYWVAPDLDQAMRVNDGAFEDRVNRHRANLQRNIAAAGTLGVNAVKSAYLLPTAAGQVADFVIELTDHGLAALHWTHAIPLAIPLGRIIIRQGSKVFTISSKEATSAQSEARKALDEWTAAQARSKAQPAAAKPGNGTREQVTGNTPNIPPKSAEIAVVPSSKVPSKTPEQLHLEANRRSYWRRRAETSDGIVIGTKADLDKATLRKNENRLDTLDPTFHWGVDEGWLEGAVRGKKPIRVVTPFKSSDELSGYFQREIKYLESQGYTLKELEDGLYMASN